MQNSNNFIEVSVRETDGFDYTQWVNLNYVRTIFQHGEGRYTFTFSDGKELEIETLNDDLDKVIKSW